MTEQAPEQKTNGKGRATPKRKEAQAANIRPLVSDKSKEGREAAKAKAKAERERFRAGQAAGDDRFLPVRERGPQRRLVRDLVDSRYSVGEFLVPVMVLFALLSFIDPTNPQSSFNQILNIAILLVFFLIAVDSFAIYVKVKKATAEKFGDQTERGLVLYGILRSTQLRAMRMPKPRVKPNYLKKD